MAVPYASHCIPAICLAKIVLQSNCLNHVLPFYYVTQLTLLYCDICNMFKMHKSCKGKVKKK